ncbi:hypothetical protein [Vibrio crassostreae]|uniref:hypothetical protein n=1 Tax=Vibrio crassostreae TaxID=246167 RepID=UPI001B312372|nr:hypothetical protein [Vibrio crassostreae]
MEKSAVTQALLCASCWERSLLGDEIDVMPGTRYQSQDQQSFSQGFLWHRGIMDFPALNRGKLH